MGIFQGKGGRGRYDEGALFRARIQTSELSPGLHLGAVDQDGIYLALVPPAQGQRLTVPGHPHSSPSRQPAETLQGTQLDVFGRRNV